MASNLIVARGGMEYVTPISLVFGGVFLVKKKSKYEIFF